VAEQWANDLASAHPEVLEVWLVGSRVKGDATADSDYDFIVLVDGSGPFPRRRTGWMPPVTARRYATAAVPKVDICIVPTAHAASVSAEALLLRTQTDVRAVWRREP
jgi:hypothetical protein